MFSLPHLLTLHIPENRDLVQSIDEHKREAERHLLLVAISVSAESLLSRGEQHVFLHDLDHSRPELLEQLEGRPVPLLLAAHLSRSAAAHPRRLSLCYLRGERAEQ